LNANTSRQRLEGPRRALSALFLGSGAAYLGWRSQTLDSHSLASSVGLFILEGLIYALTLWKTWSLSQLQVRAGAPAPQMPCADVAVRADGAPTSVLRKSLLAALAVQGRRDVWLLDSEDSAERARLAAELGCRYVNSANTGWEPVISASDCELLALFRAGDTPRHSFLQQLAGHFGNKQIAFVQAAVAPRLSDMRQRARPAQSWETELCGGLDNLTQQARDARGAVLMGDSCVLVRREALQAAGGWEAGEGLAAAWASSLRLHRKGWRGAFHAELLAFQVASELQDRSIDKAEKALAEGWRFWRKAAVLRSAGLTLAQRLTYMGAAVGEPLRLAALTGVMVAPALTWTSGRWPVQVPVTDWLSLALPLGAAAWLVSHELARGRSAALAALRGRLVLLGAVLGRPLGGAARGLMLLGGVNLVSLALAAWRLGSPGTTPTADASLALGWAAGQVMLLAWAASAALRHGAAGRATHRFTVSVSAELTAADGQRLKGTVDDLSERGLRFHGTLLDEPQPGQRMAGVLHLPDGPLHFQAEVRHIDQASDSVHLPRTLGCRITTTAADQLRLETFLYSADLPWQRLVDGPRHHTLLSRWFPDQVAGPQARQLEQQVWRVAQLREHVTADARPAMVAASGTKTLPDLLISPTELPDGGVWVLDVFGTHAQGSRGVALQRTLDTNVGRAGFFSYRLQPAPMPSIPERPPQPVDRALLLDDLPKWSVDTAPARRRRVEYEFE
jgi:PilZ domain